MNENVVGYLLDALDPEDRREVEVYLNEHPEAQRQLDLLQAALEPLAADQDTVEPPAGLWVRALARVAEDQCHKLPPAPAPNGSRAHGRAWWRRADVLVAAAVLLCVSLVSVPGISVLRAYANRQACANNLRQFYAALTTYGSQNNGAFPKIERRMPAAMFVPVLHDAGALSPNLTIACPSNGRRAPDARSVKELERLPPKDFQEAVRRLAGCYSYTLGYEDPEGMLRGLRAGDGDDLPLMSDRPLLPQDGADEQRGDSPNHGGGQNILYVGGHVRFHNRYAGRGDDDIFLNRNGKVGAGVDVSDSVLGTGADRPSGLSHP